MLTILAWMIFIPALFWNFIFFIVAFVDIVGDRKFSWANKKNARDALISFTVLFIPGIYLFGIF